LEIIVNYDNLQRYLDKYIFRLSLFVSRNDDLQNEVKIAIINIVDGIYVFFMQFEWIKPVNIRLDFCQGNGT
jgi:hypothetical protein